MSLTAPSLTKVSFSALAVVPAISPLAETFPIAVPLKFDSLANLQVISGTYTPANDIFNIVTGLASKGINFYILITDGPAVFGDKSFQLVETPMNKLLVAMMPPPQPGQYFIDGFSFCGLTNFRNPMAQGVPVNYTLVLGTAVIT